ncbi:hypothetical protein FSPOR_10517 [Fusarium sporotrichioides]|uniref:Uncharacterized protein n=1 Tax=Fusarium sporotrichioides TaxID=5514 RepID=A0A395RKK8_FUSSP|nr:hypothetical protein FSPOR_10517 [Fusarium sporotrichioides]
MVSLLISISSTTLKRQEIMNKKKSKSKSKSKNNAPVACSYAGPSDESPGDQGTACDLPDATGPPPCIMVNEVPQYHPTLHGIRHGVKLSSANIPRYRKDRIQKTSTQSNNNNPNRKPSQLNQAGPYPDTQIVCNPGASASFPAKDISSTHPEFLPDLAVGRYRSQYLLEGPQPLLSPGQDPIKVEFSMKLQSLPDDIRFQIVDNMLFCQKKHGHGPLEF